MADTANVPDWCRPGAPAVITAGADDHADSGAREMWRAVTITSVTDEKVTVRANPPYTGRSTFRPAGPDSRPRITAAGGAKAPAWFLAPADAPDVVAQRQRRDEAKRGHEPTDQ